MADYGLVQLRYNRVRPSGQPAEDVAVNTMHLQVSDGGLTSGDGDDFMNVLSTWWANVKVFISNNVSLAEVRFYDLPATAGPSGPPAFTRTLTSPTASGSGAAELPHQVACSITFETDIRRRWGRIYLPFLVNSTLTSGRFTTTFVDEIATRTDTFLTGLRTVGMGVVVWHRASWTPADVTTIRVDDVPDVIRRRRLGQKFYFNERSLLT